MKRLLAFLAVIAWACVSHAQQAATTPPALPASASAPVKPGMVVIDGKKFFSLAGARRFNGDSNSPAALQVVHHPRPAGFSARHTHTLPMAQSEDGSAAKTPSNAVLSVFAPPDNAHTAPLP